jgi:hypothetical protein
MNIDFIVSRFAVISVIVFVRDRHYRVIAVRDIQLSDGPKNGRHESQANKYMTLVDGAGMKACAVRHCNSPS